MKDFEANEKIATSEPEPDKQEEPGEKTDVSSKIKEAFSSVNEKIAEVASGSEHNGLDQQVSDKDGDSFDSIQQDQETSEVTNKADLNNNAFRDVESPKEESENEIRMVDSTAELYEEINEVREEYKRDMDAQNSLIQEEIEEVVKELQNDLDDRQRSINNTIGKLRENIEEELELLEEEVDVITEDLDEVKSQLDEKTEDEDYQELRHEVDEIEDKLTDTQEEVSRKASYSAVKNVKEIQEVMANELNYKEDKYDVTGSSDQIKDQLSRLQERVKRLGSAENTQTHSPSDVDRDMLGEACKVSGTLKIREELEGSYLYTLQGSDGELIVRSDEKLSEGKATVEGMIKEMDDVIFLELIYS